MTMIGRQRPCRASARLPTAQAAEVLQGVMGAMRDLWFWLTTLVLVLVLVVASWALLAVVLRPMLTP